MKSVFFASINVGIRTEFDCPDLQVIKAEQENENS